MAINTKQVFSLEAAAIAALLLGVALMIYILALKLKAEGLTPFLFSLPLHHLAGQVLD